jgi:hypothetical protein
MRQPRPEAPIPVVPPAAPWRHRLAGLLLAAGALLGSAVPAPALAAPPPGAVAPQPPAPPPRGNTFARRGVKPNSANAG